jgi:O-antigen/teichoic acid export membrane protein
MGAAQVVGLVLQLASQIVLARLLTPHDVGIYAVGLAVVGALSILQALGLQSLIVREDELTEQLKSTTFSINVAFGIALSLVVIAVGYTGAAFLGDPAVAHVLYALSATPIITIFSFMPLALLEREGNFREIALSSSCGNIMAAIVTMILALNGFSYMSAAYAQWASALAVIVVLRFLAKHPFVVTPSFAAWRRVSRFAFTVLAVNGISAITGRLSDIVLPRFLGLAALGIYSRASGLNGLVWLNVHLFIGRVMLVDFVGLIRSGVSIRDRYIAAVDITTALLWPVFAGFAVITGPFILTVFGEKWLGASIPLVMLLCASIVQISITLTWELFVAADQLTAQARIESWRALAAMGLFIGGCAISLEAAAASRIIEALIAVALYRPHINRMTDTTVADLWAIYLRNLALSLVAIAPTAILMSVYDWSPATPLLLIGTTIVVGVVLWLTSLALVRHRLVREFATFVEQKRGRALRS